MMLRESQFFVRPKALALVFVCFLSACGGGVDLLTVGTAAPKLGEGTASSQRILVIGGTSGIGLETVKLAVQRGHTVTALARRPERMTYFQERLHIIKGDVLDATSIATAVGGHDAVVFAVGVSPTREPVTVFSQGTDNVLKAMEVQGVSRLIAVTGVGAGDSRGHGGFFYDRILQPLLLGTIYEDKDRMEALIQSSDSRWTIVRPGALNDKAGLAGYRVIQNMEGVVLGSISRADVAHYILSQVEASEYAPATVALTDPG
jgi:putative NADH-flavin reductase